MRLPQKLELFIFHHVKHLTICLLGCLLLKNRTFKKEEGLCPQSEKWRGHWPPWPLAGSTTYGVGGTQICWSEVYCLRLKIHTHFWRSSWQKGTHFQGFFFQNRPNVWFFLLARFSLLDWLNGSGLLEMYIHIYFMWSVSGNSCTVQQTSYLILSFCLPDGEMNVDNLYWYYIVLFWRDNFLTIYLQCIN